MAFSYDGPEQKMRLAAKAGDTETVKALLDRGISVHAAPARGLPAVMLALRARRIETVRLLLERGAELNPDRFSGETAFIYAQSAELIALLGEYGLVYKPAMVIAAELGMIENLQLLLDRGVDINESVYGVTALMAAAGSGHLGIVESLLQQGAEVPCRDQRGQNALDYALKGMSEQKAGGQAAAQRDNYMNIIRLLSAGNSRQEERK
jgi:ankyrin repeat protein